MSFLFVGGSKRKEVPSCGNSEKVKKKLFYQIFRSSSALTPSLSLICFHSSVPWNILNLFPYGQNLISFLKNRNNLQTKQVTLKFFFDKFCLWVNLSPSV